jgi:glycerophosphoryl diester phosphodiesterase
VDLLSPPCLTEIAGYAYGIGADKELLTSAAVVRDAHRAGLAVHAWTFRAENRFLPQEHRIGANPDARGDVTAEYEDFLRLGVDGFFTDHPDTAVAAINAVRRHREPVSVS